MSKRIAIAPTFSFSLFPRFLAAALFSTLMMGAGTPPASLSQLSPQQVSVNFPEANSGRGAPPRTQGAGARGTCGSAFPENSAWTALTPKENIIKTDGSNPNFYVFIPELVDRQAEFLVIDRETETIVYEATFPVNRTAGILQLTLPEPAFLEPNGTYEWSFSVICDASDRGGDLTISGWIERSPLSSEQKTQIEQVRSTQTPLAVAELYAQLGLWSETLDLLMQVRESNPAAWRKFLRSVELEQLSDTPLSQPLSEVLRRDRTTTGL